MKNILNKRFVMLLMLLLSYTTNAQDPDEPLSNDPGVAPIGDYVQILCIAAIGLAYVFIKKRKEAV